MKNKRMMPHERKAMIMTAVVPVARSKGYQAIGWADAAFAAGISESLVRRYFSTLAIFHRAIISHAIVIKDARIIAQGLSAGDSKARRAPAELINAAAELIRKS